MKAKISKKPRTMMLTKRDWIIIVVISPGLIILLLWGLIVIGSSAIVKTISGKSF